MTDFEAIARWWFGVTAISLAALPLIWWMFEGFSAVRQVFARAAGVVVVSAAIWWTCAVFQAPFRGITIWVGVLVIGAVSWTLVLRTGKLTVRHLRADIGIEILWTLLFLGYLWFRSGNAAIRDTEKPMEIALLSSISISNAVPAPDPWLAGHAINYYYLGYQWVATVANFVDVPPAYAFNLALASIFASLAMMAGGIGYAISRHLLNGRFLQLAVSTLSALFVVAAGNLETAIQFIRHPGETVDAGWWDGIGWSASRVIHDVDSPGASETINEFPAFSLTLGDLHPHVLTAPLLLAVVGIAVGFVLKPRTLTRYRLVVAGAMIGLLYASNSWDAPLGLALVVGAYLLARRSFNRRDNAIDGLVLIGASVVAVLPFIVQFNPPVGEPGTGPAADLPVLGRLLDSIGIVTWRPSAAGELLTVHGVWIVVSILFIAVAIRNVPGLQDLFRHVKIEIALPIGIIALAFAVVWAPAIILLGLPLALTLTIAMRVEDRAYRVIGALFATGFALALIPEFLYIRDAFGNRMNTVFKLYFQSWFLLALASAAGLAVLAANFGRWRSAVFAGTALMALAVTLPYSVLSVPDWRDYGTGPTTLNGLAYIQQSNPDVADTIAWLAANARQGDVLVEVPGCAYGTAYGVPWNRFSAFTGVPALLGWENHERQWRRGDPDLDTMLGTARQSAVSWLRGDPGQALQTEIPRFVIFGPQEINGRSECLNAPGYGEAGISKLENLGWQVAFQAGRIQILVHQSDAIFDSGR